jgi:hypothetical protein
MDYEKKKYYPYFRQKEKEIMAADTVVT